MPPPSRVVPFAVVLAVVATLAACTPAAEVPPPEIRSAADAVRELDGVVDVIVTRTTSGEPVPGDFGQREEPAASDVRAQVRLDATLGADAAGAAAGEAQRLLTAGAQEVDPFENVTVSTEFLAGAAPGRTGADAHPWLTISAGPGYPSDTLSTATADGYALRQAGAQRVRVYLAPDAQDPISAPALVTASTAGDLIPLARTAATLGRPADLAAPGIRYEPASAGPDLAALRLVVATAERPGVRDVAYLARDQRLTIQADAAAGAQSLADLRGWLESRRFATADSPLAYTVLDAEYTESTGWVSGVLPAAHAPHSLPLPDGVAPWPDDAGAAPCTGDDLRITWSGSDAATGHRYGLLAARNASQHACTVKAAPEVVPVNDAGQGQDDVTVEPYAPGVVPGRTVVPAGETAVAAVEWDAMSTANDADLTTTLRVTPLPGAHAVDVPVAGRPETPSGLDMLDGVALRVSPWVQALEGYSP